MPGKITPFLIILYCLDLQAQTVQYNQEFQVNTYTDYSQRFSTVSSLPDSGFVVCWESYGQDGSGTGIFAQIYNGNRTKRGEEFKVNTYTSNDQRDSDVGSLLDGGFVVCWTGYRDDRYTISGQILDKNGIKRGEEFNVDTNPAYSLWRPHVSDLSDGGFVICWGVLGFDDTLSTLYGQIYNNNGTKRGQKFQVNTTGIAVSGNVSKFNEGGFVICWPSSDQDGIRRGIIAQLFDNNGTKIGNKYQVNTSTEFAQSRPKVCTLSNSDFVICWQSHQQDGDELGIFGQRFSSDGVKKGQEFQVNTYVIDDQVAPDICSLADGGFVICWQSYGQEGWVYGIFAQIFNDNGKKTGYEFQVNTYTDNSQWIPSISGLANRDFVVCWESNYHQDGSGDGIYGKYYLGNPILHTLGSYSLLKPIYDATLDSVWVNFNWQQTSKVHFNFFWELEYKLYLDITEDFIDPEIFSDIYDTTFSVRELTPGQTYFWKVLAKNIEGDSLWSSDIFGFFVSPDATQMKDDSDIHAQNFKLYSNYPNPFNPETTIRYNLPGDQSSYRVVIKIYDVLGQLVVTLRDEQQPPGLYQLTWDGRNSMGQAVPSGVYFCVLDAGSFKATQKMLLVR
ncbi:MAG: T9SS type A sorting domain-containing protein [Calditrichia bacterium]|nr:T9SS type A sorting domain-containing protein [Calditrichia bacterium]